MSSTLYHTQIFSRPGGPAGPRVMAFSHSLMTTHDFLLDTAQRLIETADSATGQPWTAVLVDNRCHGQSAALALPGPHNVDAMADDFVKVLSKGLREGRWGQPEVLVGHSIGGLIVLEVAERLRCAAKEGSGPAELLELGVPKQVWMIDSRATPVGPDHPYRPVVDAVFAAFAAIPQPMPSEQPLVDAFMQVLRSKGVQDPPPPWLPILCKAQLKPDPVSGPEGGYVIHYNPEAITEMMDFFYSKDLTHTLQHPPEGCTVHLLQGAASEFWLADGQEELALFQRQQEAGGRLQLHAIEGAGHWIPVTHQDEMVAAMAATFPVLKLSAL